MKTEHQIWREELAGKREYSAWPIVAVCFVAVVAAIAILKVMP